MIKIAQTREETIPSKEAKIHVVMYHYVRPKLLGDPFHRLKSLHFDGFKRQLEYLSSRFHILTVEEFEAVLSGAERLNRDAALLTFDDGLKDHIRYVLPALASEGLAAAFFPSVSSTNRICVLDVHKVQFILSVALDHSSIIDEIERYLDYDIRGESKFSTFNLDAGTRLEAPDTLLLKRLLQRDLPLEARRFTLDRLFLKYVSSDEKSFADDLYMNIEDVRSLVEFGMHVGGHSDTHPWLETLSNDDQARELISSTALLRETGVNSKDDWTFAYPFGSYNEETLAQLTMMGCKMAFTTQVGLVEPGATNRLEIPRMDTIDYPH